MPQISQRAVDAIVAFEVSSRRAYEKLYQRPEWPRGASGVTIAIGYDLGYASHSKITKDWANLVSPEMLSAMQRCSGVTGDAAAQLLPQVRSKISIPWDDAMTVFLQTDVPEWTDRVCRSIQFAKDLPPDSLGAIVSLAYNRGASFDNQGDRYREMRDVKMHINEHAWVKPPADIRAMKRLWPNVQGLRDRRDIEAKMFWEGVSAPVPAGPPVVIQHRPNENPPPLPPAKPGVKEHGSAGTIAGGTIASANDAASAGWTTNEIILLVLAGLALAAVVWLGVRWYVKRQPVTARAKDAPIGVTT